MTNEKVYAMPFAKVYPLLVNKAVKKGRTADEVDQVTGWLTGYTPAQIARAVETGVSYGDFFPDRPGGGNRGQLWGLFPPGPRP